MDMATFKATLEKYKWKDCLMAILFDNNAQFIFDKAEYEEVQGPISTERHIIRYLSPEEYLLFDDDLELVGMKQMFQMKDRTNPLYSKAYYIDWKPVETVQSIVFCDEDNKPIRPFFDTQHA